MRDIVIFASILGLIPVVLIRPYVGILLWAWISYMNPHRLGWGFTFDYPFAMVVGVATILAWVISRERKIPPSDAVTVLIIVLAIWVSITTLFAEVPDEAFTFWGRTMKLLVMTVVAILVVNTRERIHALIWIIVISVGYFGVKGGLFSLVTGSKYLVLGPPDSYLEDNNSLSLALIMIVPLIRYLQLHSSVVWVRLGLYVALLLCLVAIVGSYSRGALLGAAAMLVVMVVKSRRRGLIIGAGLIIATFALAFTPEGWLARMQTIGTYEEDESAQGRFDAWKFAYRLSLDRPIVGGGFRVENADDLFLKYVPDAPRARSFHSIIFEMLGEHGWVGLSISIALLFAGVILARSVERRSRGRPDLLWARDLAAMCQVAMAGYFVTGLFQDHAFFDLYYHVLAVIAVIYGIVKKETAELEAPHQVTLGTRAEQIGVSVPGGMKIGTDLRSIR